MIMMNGSCIALLYHSIDEDAAGDVAMVVDRLA